MEVDGIQTFSRLSLSLSVYILESVDPSRRRLSSLTHSLRLTSSFRFHQLRMDGIIHDNGRFKSGKRQPHYMGRKREKERKRERERRVWVTSPRPTPLAPAQRSIGFRPMRQHVLDVKRILAKAVQSSKLVGRSIEESTSRSAEQRSSSP